MARNGIGGHLLWLALVLIGAGAIAAEAPPAQRTGRAEIKVEGLGLVGDRKLRQTLVLLLGDERGATLGANAVEDAALILFSTVQEKGYLHATVTAVVSLPSGAVATYPLDAKLERPLPRGLAATGVLFRVKTGRRFNLAGVDFGGLTELRPEQARTYFRGEGLLAPLTSEQAYSRQRLRRSAVNLEDELRARGYAEVKVRIGEVRIDEGRGRVYARIEVEQGPKWRVSRVEYRTPAGSPAPTGLRGGLSAAWSSNWQHEREKAIRAWYYQHGYPDVALRLTPVPAGNSGGERSVTVEVDITPGPAVRVGRIRFVGNRRIPLSTLRPLVRLRPGEPLDPAKAADGQVRISRLGAFRSVELGYEPAEGSTRDAVYQLEEGKRQTVDLMLGWGSFEQLRGGVEWRDNNIFRQAAEGRLKLVQSMKSSEGEYDYVVPELFGSSTDGTAKAFGFVRHERSFLDEEYGATLSAVTAWTGIGADLTTSYNFVRLKASQDTLGTYLTDRTQANASSVQATLVRDRRDNPLMPRHGYKVSLQLEEAAHWLGGQVDFQELQLSASYHTRWTAARWIHIGFDYSAIGTFAASATNQLPPNVLFYPGGEDSIRGYGRGQAAPRDANGNFIGARSMAVVNLELEQALTSKFSLVAFSDSLATVSSVSQHLFSAGLGLRVQTIVGPIRLEYGRNLNPRQHDPSGTVLVSVGYPF